MLLSPISPPAEKEKRGGSERVPFAALRSAEVISTFRIARYSRAGTIKNSSTAKISCQYLFFIYVLSKGKFQIGYRTIASSETSHSNLTRRELCPSPVRESLSH